MTNAKLKTPAEFAAELYPDSNSPLSGLGPAFRSAAERATAADREAIAAWCDEQAVDARDAMRGSGSDRENGCFEQGKAEAFEAVAAYLRGTT